MSVVDLHNMGLIGTNAADKSDHVRLIERLRSKRMLDSFSFIINMANIAFSVAMITLLMVEQLKG